MGARTRGYPDPSTRMIASATTITSTSVVSHSGMRLVGSGIASASATRMLRRNPARRYEPIHTHRTVRLLNSEKTRACSLRILLAKVEHG